MSDTGKVSIHGKEYKTVALRINEFRDKHPVWTILTELVHFDDSAVIMKAIVQDESGRTISTGFSEENRASGRINKTSAMENAETSAVGRALAFFGLAGSEIASADEVANAIKSQSSSQKDTRHSFGDYRPNGEDHKKMLHQAIAVIDGNADWDEKKKEVFRQKAANDSVFCVNMVNGVVK